MAEALFLIILGLIWLVIASIQDLKKREIPNWLSFSLILFALAYRALYSSLSGNWMFFVFGLGGFVIFFGLAYLFYYGRIFAGGDAKLLMGIGAVLPISSYILSNLVILSVFVLLFFFIGGVWGLGFSAFLVLRNRKKFSKEFLKQFKLRRNLVFLSLIFSIIILVLSIYFWQISFLILALIVFLLPVLFIYAKVVEEAYMVQKINAKDLAVGDWLVEKVKVGRRTIKPYWEGLSEKEVKLIKKYKKEVTIKQGIPFVPSFLLAFIVLLLLRYLDIWSL